MAKYPVFIGICITQAHRDLVLAAGQTHGLNHSEVMRALIDQAERLLGLDAPPTPQEDPRCP